MPEHFFLINAIHLQDVMKSVKFKFETPFESNAQPAVVFQQSYTKLSASLPLSTPQ